MLIFFLVFSFPNLKLFLEIFLESFLESFQETFQSKNDISVYRYIMIFEYTNMSLRLRKFDLFISKITQKIHI